MAEEKKKDNLEFYNKLKDVPDRAKKTIGAGRLKGMTDINPMWRIEKLTEIFGPVGLGWYTEIIDKEVIIGKRKRKLNSFVRCWRMR